MTKACRHTGHAAIVRDVLIPEHWAEARVEGEVAGRPRVVRRFGWSNQSFADAQRLAEERALHGLSELRAGRRVAWREAKLAYGDEGLPIREEVLARTELAVVTRNRYGARCLNEPDVWFGDIDHDPRLSPLAEIAFDWTGRLLFVAAMGAAIWCFGQLWIPLGCAGLFLAFVLPVVLLIARTAARGGEAAKVAERIRVRRRIANFATRNRSTRFSIYDTPNGTRLVALHRPFDPSGDEAQELFAELDCDPAYARLCGIQACFRTRVSPKPWRIDLPSVPTRSVWPVPEDRRTERDQWIQEYEDRATDFAACRYVEDVGSGPVDPRCAEVQRIHDEMCRARTELPIA